ncbi:MAG: SelT/SelW/SelH family protein [Marinagarivorans sp.]|nr:SelT/SelW/SelH family protein [Marinagarivorans sp.]
MTVKTLETAAPPETLATLATSTKPMVIITFCTQCQWLLRSAWLAQELLSTLGEALGGVTLVPSHGGVFEITVDGQLVWERQRDGGFPDAKTLKCKIRDAALREHALGAHLER